MGSVFSIFYSPPPLPVFDAGAWVEVLKTSVLLVLYQAEHPLRYSEIGDRLGLNNTCISGKKFKDSLMMNVVEDLVLNRQVRWSPSVGRPYVEII